MALVAPPIPLADASFRRPLNPIQAPFALLRAVPKQPPPTLFSGKRGCVYVASPFLRRSSAGGLRVRSFLHQDVGIVKASNSGVTPSSGGEEVNEMLEGWRAENSSVGTSLLVKLAIALGIAATITLMSAYSKMPSLGTPFRLPFIDNDLSQSVRSTSHDGFNLSLFGYRIIIPEYTPGWVYFWLLMAAGCGLFISEEALNVWVGISLARNLCLDGNWHSFADSLVKNASYIISTVLWVYWGVCISDMIPFYLGKLFRQTKASEDICVKLGIGKEKALSITRVVQKYGNLIGFVERFSLGVRNPTSFLAGAWGISSECFFAGVCCGGLITLPIQLGLGFLLRERPVAALATVATAVGIWTVFPYLVATSTALVLFLRHPRSNHDGPT